VSAIGLQECNKMLMAAKAGKYNGYMLEGMACPGGCIAGAGTVQTVKKAGVALVKMKKEASFEECMDTSF
ncbi:[Fe-Fe] hydrogenase large subunit C-terminal domain-containing protein, partial [Blautia faecis]|uniref:[Fe-Fe] hydrogenase large subunit C-terminal domain-containing protein n=1 Tax=Blautia faecis TaxID=871665 RepID=UPI0023EF2600